MINHPLDSFAWQRRIARAELPLTTKSIAMFLAYFADPDGSRVRPGERLLAAITGLGERAVRRHLAVLRDLGLIERVEHGKHSGRADVYQLTVPAGSVDTVPARLDHRWRHIEAEGASTPIENEIAGRTGTEDPVDDLAVRPVENVNYRTPVSGSGPGLEDPYRNLVTPLPEPGGLTTGTPVPPTNQTIHHQPLTRSSQATASLAEPPLADGRPTASTASAASAPEPSDAEYAAARDRLIPWPDDADRHMARACAELAAEGVNDPSPRLIAVRTAQLAARRANPRHGTSHTPTIKRTPVRPNGGSKWPTSHPRGTVNRRSMIVSS